MSQENIVPRMIVLGMMVGVMAGTSSAAERGSPAPVGRLPQSEQPMLVPPPRLPPNVLVVPPSGSGVMPAVGANLPAKQVQPLVYVGNYAVLPAKTTAGLKYVGQYAGNLAAINVQPFKYVGDYVPLKSVVSQPLRYTGQGG